MKSRAQQSFIALTSFFLALVSPLVLQHITPAHASTTCTSTTDTSTIAGYVIVSFKTSTTNTTCTSSWNVPAGITSANILVVGGGGGGGSGSFDNFSGGGGGGGGGGGAQVATSTISGISPSSNIAITVGAGGAGASTGGVNGGAWAGNPGSSGSNSSLIIDTSTTYNANGGGFGLGGGGWALQSSGSTACNTSRPYLFGGQSVYYLDGVGGRGGDSGAPGKTGGKPYCDTSTSTGVGGAGVGGAGNNASTSNLVATSQALQPGGQGSSSSITGTSVEYGTGGSGGGGNGGNYTPTAGAIGVRPGMGGNGGAGGNLAGTVNGALGGAGADGIVVISYALTSQSVSFSSTNPVTARFGNTYQVSGVATSGLTPVFSVDPTTSSNCSINGSNLVSFTALGNCKINLNQSGSLGYLAASQVSQTFNIVQGVTTSAISLSISAVQFQHTGTTTLTAQLTGSDGVVTFYYNNKKIFRCLNLTSTSLVATCNWRPAVHGTVWLTATVQPSNSNFAASTSAPFLVFVGPRSVARG
jgi:hypothetical protein